ncbi:phosphoinositide 3-kinase regulatory subunit 6 isoform X3 [Ranitomeya imitator]|uniref:phosphoinositide 3-kinase regulatory subunit 6 isoform X3 n=1 Tax=Ranitomeya imitator TaxID=111125 RepID=UPI0037E8FE61
MDLSATEADMVYQKVQAILRGLDIQHPAQRSDPGMLRWTLHKSLDRNPNSGNIMVGVIIKELEKAELEDNLHYIIPLLHTLMYAITKAAYISDELYERVYVFCKKILTLPKPYCTIGLDYAERLKTEKKVPGFSYQKMVVLEQNLKRDANHHQDKVLLFLDPALVSEAVCNTLLRETQASQMSHSPISCMTYVIINCIQAAHGKDCDIALLQQVLKDKSADEVELWFQEVLSVVERGEQESVGTRQRHNERLQELYKKIISSQEESATSKLQRIPLPSPKFSVHLWTDDDQLWKELMLFMRETLTTDGETEYVKEPELSLDPEGNEQHRISVWSNDSGIERDLPGAEEKELAKLYRKPCIKKKGADVDSAVLLQSLTKAPKGSRAATLQRLSGQSTEIPNGPDRLPTARVVILGDDRALGRLAKAYYSFRKREARRPHRTLKANLQFYCIPIQGERTDTSDEMVKEEMAAMSDMCELSTYLGQVDPWYDKNINTLYDRITKLALMIHFRDLSLEPVEDVFLSELRIDLQDCSFTKMNTITRKKTVVDSRGAGIQVHYQKALASNREKEGSLVLKTSGAIIKTIPSNEMDDLVCLNVYVDEIGKSSLSSGRSALYKPNGLKASNIQMRSLDLRTLSLQLDKDSRRVYNNVSSFEVFPCQEPGYSLQKIRASRVHGEGKEDCGLSRYMTKSLLLPINTFAGIIQ